MDSWAGYGRAARLSQPAHCRYLTAGGSLRPEPSCTPRLAVTANRSRPGDASFADGDTLAADRTGSLAHLDVTALVAADRDPRARCDPLAFCDTVSDRRTRTAFRADGALGQSRNCRCTKYYGQKFRDVFHGFLQ